MSKVVIVTGVDGQDGSLMVDYLIENTNCQIYGLVKGLKRTDVFTYPTPEKAKEFYEKDLARRERYCELICDVTDKVKLQAIIKHFAPDYYLNFAAQTNVVLSKKQPDQTLNVNVFGVAYALEALHRLDKPVRFFNAGSSEELSPAEYSPQDENHPRRFNNPYGISKVLAHHLVEDYRQLGMFAVQHYLYNHISERLNDDFLPKKIIKFAAKFRWDKYFPDENDRVLKLGNVNAGRDWTDAHEVIEAVWLALNADVPKDYVIASGKFTTVKTMVDAALSTQLAQTTTWIDGPSGWNGNTFYMGNIPVVISVPEFFRPEEEVSLMGDSSLIYKDLGWKACKPVEKIIEEMIIKEIDKAGDTG